MNMTEYALSTVATRSQSVSVYNVHKVKFYCENYSNCFTSLRVTDFRVEREHHTGMQFTISNMPFPLVCLQFDATCTV